MNELGLWVEIDRDAVASNVATLKSLIAPGVKLLAVVKANGYGHGDAIVAEAAVRAGADWLGVARVEEGESLRRQGIDVPILMLAEPPEAAVERAVAARLVPTIYTSRIARAFAETASGQYPVHVKVDTGMHRYGVLPEDLKALVDEIDAMGSVNIEGICSHFAVAEDVLNPFTRQQLERFMQAVSDLGSRAEGMIRHMCNSAGTMTFPEAHFDMVRPGIAIYGIHPSEALSDRADLKPVMSIKSRVGLVKRLPAGEAISYGQRYRLERESTIATIPCGYADGLRRALTNTGEVLIGGKRYKISGTVTMDHFLVDVGDDEVHVGDEVVLIGAQGSERIGAHELARLLGTIPYEVVCDISARVPRVAVGGTGGEG